MMAGSADGDVFVFTALGDSGTATGLTNITVNWNYP